MNPLVIIPTLNAAEHLAHCLRSVCLPGVSVFIADQGSTDKTLDIADNFGAAFSTVSGTFETKGEMNVRTEMTDMARDFYPDATHIITLDADEILSDGWQAHLIKDRRLVKDLVFTVPYYQLIGDARYMQVGNPIETRPTIFPVECGPKWVPQPGRNYHCGPTFTGPATNLTTIKRIHLGWIGDLRRRLNMCCDRKDWSTRDDVNAEAKTRIAADPYSFLQPVVPVAQDLLDSSQVLRDLVAEHTKTRVVHTVPHGDALKITRIEYGTK